MSILIYLIPAALFLGLLGLIAFLWALKSGQFDDMDGAAARILIDEDSGLDEVAISVPGGVADNGERHDQAEKQSDDPDKRHQGDQPGP
ncbi:MAG: cbb3-type cytochrome oxidase assembly protein CcoS [Rhodospirillaceae bacterium]|jgi:cbb3-type cytochrome oxidase maturation protein|nr:cbb3-type cytochrome oxidase assembly protein CcoS [Rhodospirillaceae bacterium]